MSQTNITDDHASGEPPAESSSRILMVDAAVRAADSAPDDQAFEYFVHELSSSLGVDSIFDEPTDVQSRRLIAIGFLRVLQENDLNESHTADMRRRVVQHVSEAIGTNLQTMGFELEEQTHELVAKLRSVMGNIYQQLRQAVVMLDPEHASIDVSKYREALLKIHNQHTTGWVTQELMDEQSMGVFKEALNYAVSHENSSEPDFIDSYHTAQKEIQIAIDQLGSYGEYAANYFQDPLERIKKHLAHKFEATSHSRPAKIKVSLAPKEYPVSAGSQFDLRLQVSNDGEGPTLDASISFETDELRLNNAQADMAEGSLPLELDELDPGHTYPHTIDALVLEETSDLLIETRWTNTDLSKSSETFVLHIPSQAETIPWDDLKRRSPFNQTIAEGETFVGRDKLLNQLIRLCTTNSMNSAYIWGQKRVGKTSLVRRLEEQLASLSDGAEYLYIYIDQFREPTAAESVRVLGTEIMEQMKTKDESLATYQVPELKDSLSPVRTFVRNAIRTSGKRFVFVIDEFDEMPRELYEDRSDIGSAFFQNLGKGFSSIAGCCFFLVGGELIPVIKDVHGMATNQFDVVTVGPFDRIEEYADFEAMVKSGTDPVHFHDSAIEALWDACHGHPYFLNMIGAKLWDQILNTRDASVTSTEVDAAINKQLHDIDGGVFAHYWDDGIQQDLSADENQQNLKDLITQQRQQLFIATANVHPDGDGWLSRNTIIEEAQRQELSASRGIQLIDEFVERKILEAPAENSDDRVRYMVPLFYRWLRVRGFHYLRAALARKHAGGNSLQANEDDVVAPGEIFQLIEDWPHIRGTHISEGRVQKWLENFLPPDQPLMFKLLKATKVYTEGFLKDAFKDLHNRYVQNTEMEHQRTRKKNRNDVLVTDLGERSSSSLNMARHYEKENKLIARNNIPKDKLDDRLLQDKNINAIVFVDDFVGTGTTLKTQWEEFVKLHPQTVDALRTGSVHGFMFVAVGVDKAIDDIEETLRRLDVNIRVCVHLTLRDEHRAFHEASIIWRNDEEREAAKRIAKKHGAALQGKGAALGFRNEEQLVVFEHNVPNNTLPILYKNSKEFTGLFGRDIHRT